MGASLGGGEGGGGVSLSSSSSIQRIAGCLTISILRMPRGPFTSYRVGKARNSKFAHAQRAIDELGTYCNSKFARII